MSEAEQWLAGQPKLDNGKVDVRLVIAEGLRRGYCICPKPFRQMIDFTAEGNNFPAPLTCKWCDQPETRQSWEFWYGSASAGRGSGTGEQGT
jgi:hypothetical protein